MNSKTEGWNFYCSDYFLERIWEDFFFVFYGFIGIDIYFCFWFLFVVLISRYLERDYFKYIMRLLD